MTKQSAIQVANHAAEVAGYHLAGYKKPKASFDSSLTNGTWSVFYDPRFPYLSKDKEGRLYGSVCFEIIVDDKTGATKLVTYR